MLAGGIDQGRTSVRRTKGLAWFAAILVLLAAFGYFVVKPLVERVVAGAGAVIGAFAEVAAEAAQLGFEMASDQVQQSPEARAILGEPIECAAVEQTEWIDAQGRNELEFRFAVSGPKGAGVAYVIAVPSETGIELKRVEITGPDGEVVALPVL
jgi:Cytochrome oxidase complex assembly protein 1